MKYTHLYRTCIQKTLSDDQIDIMAAFKTALRNDPGLEVQLINYYKGMPLSFNATVTGVGRDELELRVNPRQAVAISDDNYTFIRSKLFKHDIVVKARHVNIREKTVSLYHPYPSQGPSADRCGIPDAGRQGKGRADRTVYGGNHHGGRSYG